MTGSVVVEEFGRSSDADLGRRILEYLREEGVEAGKRIPTEVILADRFGVSRPKVREGLRYLEGIGLLRSRQGSGRVLLGRDSRTLTALLDEGVERSPGEILNLVSVRQVLEVGFMPAVTACIDAASLARARAAVAQMKERMALGEPFAPADREFHAALYECLDNPLLGLLITRFWDLYDTLDATGLHHTEGIAERVDVHARILDAIERRDAGLAQFHMTAHFYDAVAVLEQLRTDSEAVPRL